MKPAVQWFGAHPAECSLSMDLYRTNLVRALNPETDPFQIHCWPETGPDITPRRKHKILRALGKYLGYPARVKFRSNRAEIVHFLDHSSAHLIPFVNSESKIVVTLHDLIPLRFPGTLSRDQVERFRRNVSHLEKADAIIAVSDYSKQEAIQLLDLTPEKIHVVPNGVRVPPGNANRESELTARLKEQSGAARVVISIGSTLKRKNLDLIPAVFSALETDVALLRIGARLDESLAARIREITGPDRFLEAGFLSETDVFTAIGNADAVFIPSLYEGFGLPVLEAFSMGTAVACSQSSSLPGVGGDLAAFFNPDDPAEAAAALKKAMSENSIPEKRTGRIERAREFSWRRHVDGIFNVYNTL